MIARRWLGGALVAGLLGLAGGAQAQLKYSPSMGTHLPTITPMPVTPTITPSLTPSLTPTLTPSLVPPVTINPTLTAPSVAEPQPAEPGVHAVRFRCDLMPGEQSCRESVEAHDGGGEDSECNCATDACYPIVDQASGLTKQICEKH